MVANGLTPYGALMASIGGTTTCSDAGEDTGDVHYVSPFTGDYFEWSSPYQTVKHPNEMASPMYEKNLKYEQLPPGSFVGGCEKTNKMEVELCLCSKHLWLS